MAKEAKTDAKGKWQEWKDGIPKIAPMMHFVLFLCNLMIPGLGTMIAASKCCNKEKCICMQAVIGILQQRKVWFFIGWIWSAYWGYLILLKGEDWYTG
eukprot:CAMPEP_0115028108 /NCGR_PEP_ID=MMETSP0216-20121206/36028_1 /TAXON_ID=223996 /ORGANISM="Protocruzia adherens, Strain Boccale" /LENGTH=97 /DNA_ID=CAMNT_0002404077 /DNA_START=62 /DNA_END=355 /DNA_ORIENTATION=+